MSETRLDIARTTNTYFWGGPRMAQIVFFGTFLDVNHLPGMVESSNLLPRHPNTSVDVVERFEEARSDKPRNKSLPGRPETMILAQNRVFWHVSGRKSLSRDS